MGKNAKDTSRGKRAAVACSDKNIPAVCFHGLATSKGVPDTVQFKHYQKGRERVLEGCDPAFPIVQYESDTFLGAADEESENSCGSRYMLGILPNGKDKITLHEIDLFRVKKSIKNQYADLVAVDKEQAEMSFYERRAALVDQFSTAKKKRDLASAQAGRLTDDKLDDVAGSKDAVRKRVLETGMAVAMDDPMMAALSDVAPPFNPTATEPNQIYDWFGVVPKKIFSALDGSTFAVLLSERAKLLRAKRSEDSEHYRGVLSMADLFTQLDLNTKSIRHSGKCLQVLHWLFDMYRFLFVKEEGARAPKGARGVPSAESLMAAFSYGENKTPPKNLCEYWYKTFKQDGECEVAQFNKMRMLSYIFVFAISQMPKCRLRFGILAEDLDIDPLNMVPRVAEGLGCERMMSSSKAKEEIEATQGPLFRLVAPLSFDDKGKKRRRR